MVKLAASLSEKKYRDRENAYLLEGPNLIREALQYGGRLRFIFTGAMRSTEEISELSETLTGEGLAVYQVADELISRISNTDTPQGIIAVAEKDSLTEAEFFQAVSGRNLLVLDRIQDPGNTGTLFRAAEAAGFGGVVLLKGCQDPYAPKVIRAAAGSVARMPKLFAEDIPSVLKLRESGYRLLAADMGGPDFYKADLKGNIAVIIGNEGNGISKELLDGSDSIISIPMQGSIESLNAGLAGGIIMYEALRQQSEDK